VRVLQVFVETIHEDVECLLLLLFAFVGTVRLVVEF
jgi:hypothetical protein